MADYKNMTAIEALREAKDASGMTAESIAQGVGITATHLRRYLDPNDNYAPSLHIIPGLCRVMRNRILLQWLEAQIVADDTPVTPAATRADVLTAVARAGSALGEVQRIVAEAQVLYPSTARDLCACLGIGNTGDMIAALDDDEKGIDSIDTPGGRQEMSTVSEPGLYSLILRSRKPEAKRFKRWITHEVLPSIRRTGGYGAPALPNFRNPAEAARAWADKEEQRLLEEQKRLALEQKMEEVRPKVVFAESIEVAKTSILVGEMAKLIKQATGYDIGQNRFFEWLRNRGYLHKDGSQTNMPTQRSMDAGWMEIKEGTRIGSSGESRITRTPKITGKGQIYFINLFKKMVES